MAEGAPLLGMRSSSFRGVLWDIASHIETAILRTRSAIVRGVLWDIARLAEGAILLILRQMESAVLITCNGVASGREEMRDVKMRIKNAVCVTHNCVAFGTGIVRYNVARRAPFSVRRMASLPEQVHCGI